MRRAEEQEAPGMRRPTYPRSWSRTCFDRFQEASRATVESQRYSRRSDDIDIEACQGAAGVPASDNVYDCTTVHQSGRWEMKDSK